MKQYKVIPKNFVGIKVGHLLPLDAIQFDLNGNPTTYVCKCTKCNKGYINVEHHDLATNRFLSCGCTSRKDLTGMKFDKLTVIRRDRPYYRTRYGKTKIEDYYWECKCDCGNPNPVFVMGNNLLHGSVRSCKCKRFEILGPESKYKTPEEKALSNKFSSVKNRCYNKNASDYPHYGGKGIYICDEWLNDRDAFIAWGISTGFKLGDTLDRYPDQNGPYAPWNCRWANAKMQANNTAQCHLITVDGKTRNITQWSELTGISRSWMYYNAKRNLDKVISKIKSAL